ncbi:MAG TPA: hypothetical protein IGS17_14325 [Oscillatoriales cyanobacterium M59_W2019_021]|nr:MAG: hypothetical protein D6728_01615 [Cyanobacteria bacterium J055]HIK33745.1 hypothetical protein [Oscillatoriales cyanobacterium M4454_W2019_049]HIK52079.1 hypothetical protein [Oscillatoriales cyanobacterium M59_W2019_021]
MLKPYEKCWIVILALAVIACDAKKIPETIEPNSTTSPTPITSQLPIELEDPQPEELMREVQDSVEIMVEKDGAASTDPYLDKITKIGQDCYERDPEAYSQPEAAASDVASSTLFAWQFALDNGIKVSNLEILSILDLAIQTSTDKSEGCSNLLLMEMKKRYPQFPQ